MIPKEGLWQQAVSLLTARAFDVLRHGLMNRQNGPCAMTTQRSLLENGGWPARNILGRDTLLPLPLSDCGTSHPICRLVTIVVKGVLLVLLLCGWATTPADAATRSWTGDGPSVNGFKLWSDPNNWSPYGVPQNGEDLFIGDSGGDLDMFNDLANLTIGFLRFNVINTFGIGDANVRLYGTTLGISHGLVNTNDFECQVYIHCGVRLTGNATFVTGDTLFNPLFAAEDVAMHLIGRIDLNGHDLVLLAKTGFLSEGRLYVEGGISGTGNVLVTTEAFVASGDFDHWGALEFKGAGSDFSGTLTLNSELGSEILLNVPSGVVVKDLLVVNNVGTVKLARSEQIGDGATVRVQDGATLQLNGHSETIRNLELITDSNDSRPAVLNAGNGTLSLQGNLTSICNNSAHTPTILGKLNLLSGFHDINVSGSVYAGLEMQAQMMGFGNFSKSGNSALILQSSNSFNSTISILQGTLDVRNDHGLGDIAGSTEIISGGLTLRGVSIGEELLFALGRGTGGEMPGSVLTSIGISSWAGQVALYTNLVVTGDMAFTGPISGQGGLGCFGGGTIRMGGTLANTYTGVTLARCPVLELNKSFDVNAFSGPLIVGGGPGGTAEVRWLNSYQCANPTVTLYLNGVVNLNGFDEGFGPINLYGGTISTGTGLLNINGLVSAFPGPFPSVINGRIFLPAGYREFYVYFGDGGLYVGAMVSGPGHLQKSGGGGMRLSGANSYGGLTFVDEGILTVTEPAGLGASDSGTIVTEGGTLQLLSVNGVMPERISLRGSGAAFGHGALTVVGNVTLRNPFPSIYACLDLTTNSVITVDSGAQVIADGFISGIGPLIKTGAGTLVFSNANANIYTGDTIVTAGTLELRKPSNTRAIPGNLVIGPAVPASQAVVRFFHTGPLPVNSNVTVNANSLLDLNNNNQTLARLNLNDGGDAQTGSGQLNFTAGGFVTVGTLNPPQSGLLASCSITGKIGLPELDYLTFSVGGYGPAPLVPDPELVVSAAISGAGNIVKSGFGGMLFNGNNTFNATQQVLAGDVIVNGGALLAGSATALGGAEGWTFVNNDASLALINNITIQNETLYLNSTRAHALDNRGGDNTWTGPINLSRDTGIAVSQDWSLQTLGVISGAGSLTKIGAGTLRIGGNANNTHAGNTFVDEGALWLSKAPGLAVPHDLIIGSSHPAPPAALARYLGNSQVFNRITVNANALLDLNGLIQYGGGDLTLNNGGDMQTGSGAYYLGIGANIVINPGTANNAATITGSLGLLSGQHTFLVNGGVTTQGQFDLDVPAAVFQLFPDAAGVVKTGAGRLRFGGANFFESGIAVSGGTFQVDGLQSQIAIALNQGTRLQGTGNVGQVTMNGSSIAIAPGASAGTLTTGNFVASGGSGTLEIELNSFPSGFDQINAHGTVNLNGLALKAFLNFPSALDHQFTLVNNDGADGVTGTFTGLPQNARLYIGGELFQITYTGGTGNDVLLTRLPTPPQPMVSIERLSPASVRLVWPTNNPPFSLQSSTNLLAGWSAATPPPVVIGPNNVVTNATTGRERLYRLIHL